MKKIEPTAEDWQRAEESLRTNDAHDVLMRRLALHQAQKRIERERRERRRRLINRLSLGLLGRS